jgi:hypothetical protein
MGGSNSAIKTDRNSRNRMDELLQQALHPKETLTNTDHTGHTDASQAKSTVQRTTSSDTDVVTRSEGFLGSGACSVKTVNQSRRALDHLAWLDEYRCKEGAVAWALHPDPIVGGEDVKRIQSLNEQIKRMTRADKWLHPKSNPEEYNLYSDDVWSEETHKGATNEETKSKNPARDTNRHPCKTTSIRKARNNIEHLRWLESEECEEGVVAWAMHPKLIAYDPHDPVIRSINEQILRDTRAQKKLFHFSQPEEYKLYGDENLLKEGVEVLAKGGEEWTESLGDTEKQLLAGRVVKEPGSIGSAISNIQYHEEQKVQLDTGKKLDRRSSDSSGWNGLEASGAEIVTKFNAAKTRTSPAGTMKGNGGPIYHPAFIRDYDDDEHYISRDINGEQVAIEGEERDRGPRFSTKGMAFVQRPLEWKAHWDSYGINGTPREYNNRADDFTISHVHQLGIAFFAVLLLVVVFLGLYFKKRGKRYRIATKDCEMDRLGN